LDLSQENPTHFHAPVSLRHAVGELFRLQGPSGIWPKYFPLFHFPEPGANYCFSFELLEAVLNEFAVFEEDVSADRFFEELGILEGLEKAVTWCEQNRLGYTHAGKVYRGWNSGGYLISLGQGQPESWAT